MIKGILKGFLIFCSVLILTGTAIAQDCAMEDGRMICPRCDPNADSPSNGDTKYCSSATNQITAAYATMGYWTLGAMLQKFGGIDQTSYNINTLGEDDSYIKAIGALIFMLSFFTAVIMMAMGQPPKMYAWFAAGPGVMYFLLFSMVQRHGVAWEIGGDRQDQTVVWELAYTGLKNPLVSETAVGGISDAYRTTGASYSVSVPWLFAKIDDVSSEVIQNIVGLMGIRGELPPDRHDGAMPADDQMKNWPLLSTEKWELMENITGAKITNNDLRELLVQYMSSECGDKMGEYLDGGAFAQATSPTGIDLPETVFCEDSKVFCEAGATIGTDCSSGNKKEKLLCELNKIRLPAPFVYKQLLHENKTKTADASGNISTPSFSQFGFATETSSLATVMTNYKATTISCDDWLWLIMTGIRWESGMHYANLRNSLDIPVSSDSVTQNLIPTDVMDTVFTYDWEFLKNDGAGALQEDILADVDKRQQFMIQMIMAYMARNEFLLAPQLAEQNFLPSEKSTKNADEFARTTNSKNKFAEIYVWAKMLPHVQGMILYLLSIGYPLACVMILIPGWWKWIITWASFYIWAKSWDAGFAVVQNVERSIWANLGNSNNTASLNGRILDLDKGTGAGTAGVGMNFDDKGQVQHLFQTNIMTEGEALDLFDRALVLSRALNHDLVNSYYIYLMSALYFAVPAVTGQLLLGAKSGMSNMVKEGIGGVSSEGGSAARSGAIAEETRHGTMNSMAADQMFNAKGARQEGLALKALQSKNNAMGLEMRSAALGTRSSLFDQGSQSIGDGKQFGEARNAAHMAQFDKAKATANSVMGSMRAAMAFDEVTQLAKTTPAQTAPGTAGASANTSGANTSGAGDAASTTLTAEEMKGFGAKAGDMMRKGAGSTYRAAVQHQAGKADIEAADVAAKRADWERGMQTGVLDARQAARDANIQSSMGQLVMGQQARANSEMGGRLTQQANYGMREQSYSSGAKFSKHMSGMMAARGVVAGAFDPKDKPKDLESIGAGGMLGSSYDKAFSYPSNGFMSDLGGQVNALQPAVGYASTNYQANSGSALDLGSNHQRLQGAVTQTAGLLAAESVATKDPGKGLVALAGAGQHPSTRQSNGEYRANDISFNPVNVVENTAGNVTSELTKGGKDLKGGVDELAGRIKNAF